MSAMANERKGVNSDNQRSFICSARVDDMMKLKRSTTEQLTGDVMETLEWWVFMV